MKKLVLLALLAAAVYVGYLVKKEIPGESSRARAGKAAAQPVISALANYRAAHNAYPTDLEVLADEGGGLPSHVLGQPLRYEPYDASYDLTFSYATPLPFHCTYSPGARWKCGVMGR